MTLLPIPANRVFSLCVMRHLSPQREAPKALVLKDLGGYSTSERESFTFFLEDVLSF